MADVPDGEPGAGESVVEEPSSSRISVLAALPAWDVLLVRIGGAVMVIAALMSWLESHPDARPNVAGIGPTAFEAGYRSRGWRPASKWQVSQLSCWLGWKSQPGLWEEPFPS